MNVRTPSFILALVISAALAGGAARADSAAELQIESARLERNAAVAGAGQVSSRINRDYADFAGSDTNAGSLITGLRSGSPITLVPPPGVDPRPSAITFTPPTRPMGNGNVYISLALAQQQLASLGISRPTPEQIKASLVGGTVFTNGSDGALRTVALPGVLVQRSQGMGWGNMARLQGLTLGSVVSGMRNANRDLSTIHTHRTGSTNAVTMPPSSGGRSVRMHGITNAVGGSGAGHGSHYGTSLAAGAGTLRAGSAPVAAAGPARAAGASPPGRANGQVR